MARVVPPCCEGIRVPRVPPYVANGVAGSAGKPAASVPFPRHLGVLVVIDHDLSSVPCPDGLLSLGCSRVVLPTESSGTKSLK